MDDRWRLPEVFRTGEVLLQKGHHLISVHLKSEFT